MCLPLGAGHGCGGVLGKARKNEPAPGHHAEFQGDNSSIKASHMKCFLPKRVHGAIVARRDLLSEPVPCVWAVLCGGCWRAFASCRVLCVLSCYSVLLLRSLFCPTASSA